MATGFGEVVYRGILRKHFVNNICRANVLAPGNQEKTSIACGRYVVTPAVSGMPENRSVLTGA